MMSIKANRKSHSDLELAIAKNTALIVSTAI